jgi:hypothetical protein
LMPRWCREPFRSTHVAQDHILVGAKVPRSPHRAGRRREPRFIADGAYNGEPVCQAVARQQHDPAPDVVVPPRTSAVLSTDGAHGRANATGTS